MKKPLKVRQPHKRLVIPRETRRYLLRLLGTHAIVRSDNCLRDLYETIKRLPIAEAVR